MSEKYIILLLKIVFIQIVLTFIICPRNNDNVQEIIITSNKKY